jgi:hypothetical protein
MSSSSAINRSEFHQITIFDANGATLIVQLCELDESFKMEGFDCVSLSARYDHGFGFSQLYRFVDDMESKDIVKVCDIANTEVASKFLHPSVSKEWRVLVTPVIKSNDLKFKDFYKQLMLEVIDQAHSIAATKLLLSQFNRMFTYKEHQFEGIIEAFNEIKRGSFGNLELIRFEVDSKHKKAVFTQLSKGLER